jgi:hypothetical protein
MFKSSKKTKRSQKNHNGRAKIVLPPPIADGEFAMVEQCPVNEFLIVKYKPFFGDDMYTAHIRNMEDAMELFNLINMENISAEELIDLGLWA